MTLAEIENEIKNITNKIDKLDSKEAKKGLSKGETRNRNNLKQELHKYELMKNQFSDGKTDEAPTINSKNTTSVNTTTPTTPATPATKPLSSTEKRLENVEEKAIDAADAMNTEEAIEQKTIDAKSAAETAKNRAAQIDANVEENVPTWFWREAQEMAPSSKAKRGFIITNHILNRLGTALGNTGAIIQNAGGSGGASLKEHGGSYIDQYRQSKIEQAMANRKTKQNSLLQQQIDALVAIGVPENEARVIQNKLRNSSHWNKYNRLTNEQQVYIQGLLYNDTKGKINDAALGNFIDQLMEGKNVSLEQAAVNMMAAEGIDNIDEIKSGAKAIGDKVAKWLGWEKPGE